METHVLIPRELTLKVRPNTQSPSIAKLLEPRVSIISTVELPKGLKIHPAQGTVRCGKLELYSMFGQKDRKHRYGCYDEIVDALLSSSSSYGISTEPETEEDVKPQQRVRRCNWPRFLTYLEDSSPGKEQAANLKCFLHEGQLFFETLERIPVHTDLIVAQANHGCDNGLPMIEAIAALMFESPLDLSLPLVSVIINNNNIMMTHKNKNHQNSNNNVIPSSALSPLLIEDRISVSSDSGLSSSEESDLFKRGHTPPSPPITPKSRTTSICSSSPRTTSLHSHNSVVKNNKNQQQNNNPPRASHKKMLPCSFCGKCFDRPSLLNRHLRTHTGERPHVCDICEKGFSTSSSLNTHRRIHSGEKPHECTICGKRFTASSNLYYHRMTHVKEKPHKCELCQKSFPTPGDLKSHMYIHNGSWPHRCHICDRGFSKVTNLKNHLFLHTGQKPHECIECGKRFALGCNMKAHLKTHDPNRSNNSKRIEFDEDEEEELLNVTD